MTKCIAQNFEPVSSSRCQAIWPSKSPPNKDFCWFRWIHFLGSLAQVFSSISSITFPRRRMLVRSSSSGLTPRPTGIQQCSQLRRWEVVRREWTTRRRRWPMRAQKRKRRANQRAAGRGSDWSRWGAEEGTEIKSLKCRALREIEQHTCTDFKVSSRQRGNPVLKAIRGAPWEFDDNILPDYVLGQRACAVFLR